MGDVIRLDLKNDEDKTHTVPFVCKKAQAMIIAEGARPDASEDLRLIIGIQDKDGVWHARGCDKEDAEELLGTLVRIMDNMGWMDD